MAFSPDEEALIAKAVETATKEIQDKQKQDQITAEIRNRVLDSQKGKPGYNY